MTPVARTAVPTSRRATRTVSSAGTSALAPPERCQRRAAAAAPARPRSRMMVLRMDSFLLPAERVCAGGVTPVLPVCNRMLPRRARPAAALPGAAQGMGLGVEHGVLEVQGAVGREQQIEILQRLGEEVARHEVALLLRDHALE